MNGITSDLFCYPIRRCVVMGSILLIFLSSIPAQGADRSWDTWSDTWSATDGLGRVLPDSEVVGPVRTNRFVGMFYFLWLGRHGEDGPFDISQILKTDPSAINQPHHPLWGPMHVPHHWGESIFGYYVGEDESVLRKHAQMLSDAGVDVLIFDVTNQLTYPESWRALCKVFAEIREKGGRTPQIAFLTPFWNPQKVVHELYRRLYQPRVHPELWFSWENKPLLLADPDLLQQTSGFEQQKLPSRLSPGKTLGQSIKAARPFRSISACLPTWHSVGSEATVTLRRDGPSGPVVSRQRFTDLKDNGWVTLRLEQSAKPDPYYLELSDAVGAVGWWGDPNAKSTEVQAWENGREAAGIRTYRLAWEDEETEAIRKFFTFRKPQPDYFTGPAAPGEWGWLEVTPQHLFRSPTGAPEEVTVGVAQNALDGKLSALSNPRSHGRSFHGGQQPGPEGQTALGANFSEQWDRAFQLDPPFVFVTGWNEWIAGRFTAPSGFHGDGPVTFVDEFSPEYSRDIEPMKGGHGDAYYHQLVSAIRRFKGVRAAPPTHFAPIVIDGLFDDWRDVAPEFRDDWYDPVHRSSRGWGKGTYYNNTTGRNDLIAAKVSVDATQVYFYVRTREPITSPSDSPWMLLFLNTDQNGTNGWLGYDFVVGRSWRSERRRSLERHEGKGYQWSGELGIQWRVDGNEMELAIPRAALRLDQTSGQGRIEFKWVDNIRETGDWSDFTLNGDAAPNDRFNFSIRF